MANMSDYLEDLVIKWLARNTDMPGAPNSIFLSLHTAAPSEAAGSNEVTGGAYARLEVTTGTAGSGAGSGFDAPTGGATANSATLTWPTASGANWGTITHVGAFDASTAGNFLFWAALTSSKVVNDGDVFEITAGNLDIAAQ
jgi:hypothetical protein